LDTALARIAVLSVASVSGAGRLLALASVELDVDGVAIVLHGVQVRADGEKTEIALPHYRNSQGAWKPAVTLPTEVRGPMGEAVIAAGLEAGILKDRV
jgi:stage V sporulation protein G